jgi:Mor family transcriptional regulator
MRRIVDNSVRPKILKDWINKGETYQVLADRYKVSKFLVGSVIQQYLNKKVNDYRGGK